MAKARSLDDENGNIDRHSSQKICLSAAVN